MRKLVSVILFFCLFFLGLPAQEKDTLRLQSPFVHTLGGQAACFPLGGDKLDRLLATRWHSYWSYEFAYQTSPERDSAYSESYGYPLVGVGFSYLNNRSLRYLNNSHFSDFYSLYLHFERPFVRLSRFKLSYMLQFGGAYTKDLYNPFTNPYNYTVGNHLMVYVGTGLRMDFKISRHFSAGLQAQFFHHSNGKTAMPNGGMDEVSAGAFLRYSVAEQRFQRMNTGKERLYKKGFQWDLFLIGGVKVFEAEWLARNETVDDPAQKRSRFQLNPRLGFSADVLYRYAFRNASGLCMDFLYTWGANDLRAWEDEIHVEHDYPVSPISVGLGVMHELRYSNFSITVCAGVYLFNRLGWTENPTRFYQKLGVRYYFPKLGNTFVGWGVKAYQLSRADYMELSLGIRLG